MPEEVVKPYSHVQCRLAEVSELLDLRLRILRAGLPRESAMFDGDVEPTTLHAVAIEDAAVVGCATLVRRPWENAAAWQLRGMAVDASMQRSGIGRMLLRLLEHEALKTGYSRQLWCNARTPAVEFYRRLGWTPIGEQFEIPTAGPHYRMAKLLG